MRWQSSLASTLMALFPSVAQPTDINGLGSGFSMYKSRLLASVLPFDVSTRTETHLVMQRLGQLSLNPLFNEVVAEIETTTFPDLPILVLRDNDNDSSADFFVYHTVDGPSGLYGTFYGLSQAGLPEWIVFPNGPVIDENKEFLFLFTHWVDQNSDGKLDLIVYEGIDMNGSGLPEAGASAWLADEDFDGLVDAAMHCTQQICKEIEPEDGVYELKRYLTPGESEAPRVGEAFPEAPTLNGLFKDLAISIEKSSR